MIRYEISAVGAKITRIIIESMDMERELANIPLIWKKHWNINWVFWD